MTSFIVGELVSCLLEVIILLWRCCDHQFLFEKCLSLFSLAGKNVSLFITTLYHRFNYDYRRLRRRKHQRRWQHRNQRRRRNQWGWRDGDRAKVCQMKWSVECAKTHPNLKLVRQSQRNVDEFVLVTIGVGWCSRRGRRRDHRYCWKEDKQAPYSLHQKQGEGRGETVELSVSHMHSTKRPNNKRF